MSVPCPVVWACNTPHQMTLLSTWCCSHLQAVRKDVNAALQQVVDVGQGRWVKLLAARTNSHMRLKLYELKQLLDISEQVGGF